MQIISKPLTPVVQAVTDRLYNEDKISKGGPFKKSGTKSTPKASKGKGRPKKDHSVNNSAVKRKKKPQILFCHFYLHDIFDV